MGEVQAIARPIGARYVHVAAPLLFMLCLAAINLRRPGVYRRLVIEDGLVEWATVVVYVMAALLGIRLCRRLSARRSYAWVVYFFVGSCRRVDGDDERCESQARGSSQPPNYLTPANG